MTVPPLIISPAERSLTDVIIDELAVMNDGDATTMLAHWLRVRHEVDRLVGPQFDQDRRGVESPQA